MAPCLKDDSSHLQVNSPEEIQRIIQIVVQSTAKIIVVFSSDVDLSPFIGELLRHNVTDRTWIASEAWVTSALLLQPGVGAQTRVWEEQSSLLSPELIFIVFSPRPARCWGARWALR